MNIGCRIKYGMTAREQEEIQVLGGCRIVVRHDRRKKTAGMTGSFFFVITQLDWVIQY